MLCPWVLNHGWLGIALGTAAGSITRRLERRSGPTGSSRARRLGKQEKNRRNKWQAAASAHAVLSAASPSQKATLCATSSRRQLLADMCTFCSILIVTFQQNLLRMLPNTRKGVSCLAYGQGGADKWVADTAVLAASLEAMQRPL